MNTMDISMEIIEVHAREILDSRGNPTVEVEVRTSRARSVVPPFRAVLRPAKTRRWSCATATRAAIWVKVY